MEYRHYCCNAEWDNSVFISVWEDPHFLSGGLWQTRLSGGPISHWDKRSAGMHTRAVRKELPYSNTRAARKSRERDLNCFFTADRSRKAALKLPGSGKQQMVLSVDIRNREKRSLRLSKNRYYHAPETKIVCRWHMQSFIKSIAYVKIQGDSDVLVHLDFRHL